MINYIKKLIAKMQDFYKKNYNAKFVTFVILFLAINLFFWTSKAWYTFSSNKFYITQLDSKIEAPFGRIFSIVSWDYSASQNLMEVQLEVTTKNVDGINHYNYQCLDRKLNSFKVEKIVESDTYIVLHILNVPADWTELSLQIYQSDINQKLKLYTNCRDIAKVENIETKTLEEYYIARIDVLINNYKDKIDTIDLSIAEEESNITNCETLISSYEQQLKYVNSDKQKEIQEQINALNGDIVNINSRITALNLEKTNCEASLKELNELKKHYGGN